MKKTTHLYILVYPEKSAIKIGKADDVGNRIATLRSYWGEIDYAASYLLEIDVDTVFKLEKALHCFLQSSTMNYQTGDGKTEFFSIDTLEQAVELTTRYLELNPGTTKLKKGIQKELREPRQKTAPLPKGERARIKAKRKKHDRDECRTYTARNCRRMYRIISWLSRHQSHIQFQCDVQEGGYLEIRTHGLPRLDFKEGKCPFSMRAQEAGISLGINVLGCTSWSGDTVQYSFRTELGYNDDSDQAKACKVYLEEMFSKVQKAFNNLPPQSEGLTEPIAGLSNWPRPG